MNSHVLYLALGTYRVRATREQVKELASSGSRVSLVVLDAPEWREALEELGRLDGVEVVRVAPDRNGTAWGSAKKLAAARSGPFAEADTIVAGDAQALPVAWIAKRRRPGVALVLEPHGAGRVVEPSDLAVLTPWYPSPNNPYAGSFVQAATAAVAGNYDRVTVFHTEDWTGRASAPLNDAIRVTADRLRERGALGHVVDADEATVVRVPVPLIGRRNYAPWVEAQVKALRSALPGGRIEAPVVHAHTGIYGGVLATRLARPDARVVVTEHSSFLDRVFSQAPAAELYEQVLERADAFACVSAALREQVVKRFPRYADKVGVVPNPVPLDRFTPGPERSLELLRWLYLGRLVQPKGVKELLEAFALVAAEEPRATLTMVGHGPAEEELRARGAQLGLGERFRILPPVAPEAVGPLMHEYDLLVHASKRETFGMTVVEAIASGLPVLATRSGGPQETLAGVETLAGALMDVSDDPRVIVDAYRGLRARAGDLDLPAAREALEGRVGREAVGKQLVEVYGGALPPVPDPVDAGGRRGGRRRGAGGRRGRRAGRGGTRPPSGRARRARRRAGADPGQAAADRRLRQPPRREGRRGHPRHRPVAGPVADPGPRPGRARRRHRGRRAEAAHPARRAVPRLPRAPRRTAAGTAARREEPRGDRPGAGRRDRAAGPHEGRQRLPQEGLQPRLPGGQAAAVRPHRQAAGASGAAPGPGGHRVRQRHQLDGDGLEVGQVPPAPEGDGEPGPHRVRPRVTDR
ncbi:glycosyltransferase family 4 protein [Streptomyces sp. MRC013]|uniref:glycosyltransferase family 4 protein n=1 Tax=Streptomyces sp. MRC013 TaxID=2898276 RepID=UPI0020273AA6|nr:glycosyltransferase family 4 protein [Streptomyces sp. MRC013]URM91408.1 glycosyltransferase family 4 protein [Streptomyces sp. MRC013]